MKLSRYITIITVLILLLLSTTVVFARKRPPPPVVKVLSRWTPAEQLVSISGDTRTVSLQMSAQTDRQFWAMDLSCLVSQPAVFEASSASQAMTWSASWLDGSEVPNYWDSTTDTDPGDTGTQYYDVTTNRINAVITRVGASNAPVGINGTTYTELLFDLELTIAEGVIGTNAITLNCDKLVFLDRNGTSLGRTVLSPMNTLTLRDGYILSGEVARQGNSNQDEIEVSCQHTGGQVYTALTETIYIRNRRGRIIDTISGEFSFENDANLTSAPLRDYGWYECTLTSKIGGTDDTVLLQGTTLINLRTPTYELQPITLRTGDTDPSNLIDQTDFTVITANWQDSEPAFTNGDVNGDGIVNETDLAITAGNFGLSDSSGGMMMDHVLYSVARDYNDTFPNNSLVMGSVVSGDVTPLHPGKLFWPQVSPDGSQVAYHFQDTYMVNKRGRRVNNSRRAVRTVTTIGLAVGNTNSWSSNMIVEGANFAPSWSPSGNQIAYICSWEDPLSDAIGSYKNNNGNLCITDAAGSNVQTIVPPGLDSTFAEIFPPAWYDETTLIYAGNSDNTLCPDQLCYYDILTNTHGKLAVIGIDGSAKKANMPVINRYDTDLVYLFYRRFDAINSDLRMGTVDYDSLTNTWTGGVVDETVDTPEAAKLHEQVDGISGIHYYDVSPALDVMYYAFGDYQFHNRYFVDGAEFSWTSGPDHMVDGFIGYPMITDIYQTTWDGYTEADDTDFHAYRATIDWLP